MNLQELEKRFNLRKESPAKRRTFVSAAVKGIDVEKRTIRAYASTKAWDRYGERFEPDAFAGDGLKNFKKNPVILFAHDYTQAPIAKAIDYEFDANGLILVMKFADTPKAQEVFDLYVGGFMSAFSVGFRPLEYRFEERVAGSGEMGAVFVKAELLENSAVPVPANPEAVVIKGLQGKTMTLDGALLREMLAARFRSDSPIDVEALIEERKAEEAAQEPASAPAEPAAAATPAEPAAAAQADPEPEPKGLKGALGALIQIAKTAQGQKVTDEGVRSLLIQANNLCRELVYGRGVESLEGGEGDLTDEEVIALVKEYETLSELISKSGRATDKDREEFEKIGKLIDSIIRKGIK